MQAGIQKGDYTPVFAFLRALLCRHTAVAAENLNAYGRSIRIDAGLLTSDLNWHWIIAGCNFRDAHQGAGRVFTGWPLRGFAEGGWSFWDGHALYNIKHYTSEQRLGRVQKSPDYMPLTVQLLMPEE